MSLLGHEKEAIQYLDSAFKYGMRWKQGYQNDPAFEKVKSRPDFQAVQKKVDDWWAFRKKAFLNARNRAQANKELKGLLER